MGEAYLESFFWVQVWLCKADLGFGWGIVLHVRSGVGLVVLVVGGLLGSSVLLSIVKRKGGFEGCMGKQGDIAVVQECFSFVRLFVGALRGSVSNLV